MKKSLLILSVLIGVVVTQPTLAQCSTTITQPDNALLCPAVGSLTSISVATDATSATYSWQYRVVTASNPSPAWKTITSTNAGAVYTDYTSANLGIIRATAGLPAKGTQYRAVISGGGCGDVASDAANLIILDKVKAGKIFSDASVCEGTDAYLSLSDYAGTSLQWESSSLANTGFMPIIGETTDTYIIPGATTSTHKYYRVVVTNDACSTTATTLIKTLKVDGPSVAGIVTGGGMMCYGSSATFKVTGYTGKIQWEYSKDGYEFSKAPKAEDNDPSVPFESISASNTAATYSIGNLHAPVYFRVKVNNGICSKAYSNVVNCELGSTATVGTITQADTSVCQGSGTNLTLSQGNGQITWEKSTNWTSGTPTWMATTNHTTNFATGNISVPTAYRVKISIGNCSDDSVVYSNLAFVVIDTQPVSKANLANTTSPSGKNQAEAMCTTSTSKILTISAGSVGAIQWQTSTTSSTTGFTDIAGETGTSYTISNPVVGVNYYRAKFSTNCASAYNGAKAFYYTDCGSGKVSTPNHKALTVNAYPNPYTDAFRLNITTSASDKVSITVFDTTGRLIEKSEVMPETVSEWQLGNQYPGGIYAVTLTQGNETQTIKVIKR